MNVLDGCPIESKCSASNFALFDAYEKDFVTSLTSSPNFAKPQNGAFISSCFTHCEGSQGLYNTIKVNNVSMQAAVSTWCAHEAGQDDAGSPQAAGTTVAERWVHMHIETPCSWQGPGKKDCNPTCPNAGGPKPSWLAEGV